MFAPSATGRYVSYFRLEDPIGGLFGQRLWCDIRVTDAEDNVSTSLTQWDIVQRENETAESEDLKDEEVDNVDETTTLPSSLSLGSTVKIHGLVNRPEFNDKIGSCIGWDGDADRWEITLFHNRETVMVLPSNLILCDEHEALEILHNEHCLDDTTHDEDHLEKIAEENSDEHQSMTSDKEKLDEEVERWTTELNVLKEMGFHDNEVLLPLLQRHIPISSSERDGDSTHH
jgi:hypothetical protein